METHPYALTGFVLCAAITLFFLFHIISSAIYWSNPAHHDEAVKPWMTVGYIAKSWHLDPVKIDDLTKFPRPDEVGHPVTMQEIARIRGIPLADVIRQAQTAVAALTAEGAQPRRPT